MNKKRGEIIKQLRIDAGLKTSDLAKLLNVDYVTVWRWQTDRVIISDLTFNAVCDKLRLKINQRKNK